MTIAAAATQLMSTDQRAFLNALCGGLRRHSTIASPTAKNGA